MDKSKQTPEQVDVLLAGGTVITMDARRNLIRDGAVAIRGNDRCCGLHEELSSLLRRNIPASAT